MTKKRYIIKGSDDFFQRIEDTTLTEDKHEGTIDDIYQVANRLNEQDERIKELEQENECLKDALSEKEVSDIKCHGKRINTGLFDDGDVE